MVAVDKPQNETQRCNVAEVVLNRRCSQLLRLKKSCFCSCYSLL